jgi:trafficking protein particle complex subunit 9
VLQHPRRVFRACTYALTVLTFCLILFQARTIESTTGMESLNTNLFPSVTSFSDQRKSYESPTSSSHSLPPTPTTISNNSHTDMGHHRSSTPAGRRSSTFDPTRPNVPTRHVSLAATVTSKSVRQSGLTVPPTGRLFKFLGDLYLLAGRCSDAGIW